MIYHCIAVVKHMGPMLPPVSKNWQLIYLDLKKFYKFLTKSLRDLKLVCVPTINKVRALIIHNKS